VWGPPVDPSCVHEARSVGGVPRSAEHPGVGGVERPAAIDQRMHVIERQVMRCVGRVLDAIARTNPAVLPDVAGDHPLGQASPSRISVKVMVGPDARQPRVLAAASSRSARDDATDGAELHSLDHDRRAVGLPSGVKTSTTVPSGRVGLDTGVVFALARLTARTYPRSRQAGEPGSRCGSDQRAVMPASVRTAGRDSYSVDWAMHVTRPLPRVLRGEA
jgi:hypothetical protein